MADVTVEITKKLKDFSNRIERLERVEYPTPGGGGGAWDHNLLSAIHPDTTPAAVVRGDVIVGKGVNPYWERHAIAVPAAAVRNVFGVDNGDTQPDYKTALDATNPTTTTFAGVAAPGTSLIFSHRDHAHAATGFQQTLTAGADIDITVGVVQRKGTGILLFSGGVTLLSEYAHTGAGLILAVAAAASGDVVEIPAGTITGNVTVGAGVTLRGMGWNSIIAGMLTLGVGAAAEHLKVYQSVNSASDIIGIIGPATGEATIRDVQVSLTQAGIGKSLGLLSNGGTLRAYECEVWAHGATGSTWGVAAIAGGIVEVNQGQVKAWV